MNTTLAAAVTVLMCSASTLAQGLVQISLSSLQSGGSVVPGAPIDWEITCAVSEEGNQGLALVLVDLVQDPNNPELIELPPGERAPAGMERFDGPLGLANRGPSGSSYGGTPFGKPGARNLVQIGGAQNTFGVPLGALGLNTNVVTSIGQGRQPQLVAKGSFRAPATPGRYAFFLFKPRANTITLVNPPPRASEVSAADTRIGTKFIRFTVRCVADFNNDGSVDLSDHAAFYAEYGHVQASADVDADGAVTPRDLATFLDAAARGCPR